MPRQKRIKTDSLFFSDRLLAQLASIKKFPMTVVEAPSCFGKTTAVQEYLVKSDMDVLWYAVDSCSAEEFWDGICGQLKMIDENKAQLLNQMGFPRDRRQQSEAAALISEMAFPNDTVLVIDNYELVQDAMASFLVPCFHEIIKFKIEHFHLVVLSQTQVFENTFELMLKKQLHYIRSSAFELNAEEIVNYYSMCGVSLNLEQSQLLYKRSEGWIAVLYLYLLEYSEKRSFEQDSNIWELIENVIWNKMSPVARNMMMRFCKFESLDEAAAAFLLQGPEYEGLREQLTSNTFFRYEKGGEKFVIPGFLRQYAEKQLLKQSREYQEEVCRLTGQWYKKEGEFFKAIQCFYTLKDFDEVLELIVLDAGAAMICSRRNYFLSMIRDCPMEAKEKNPEALLTMLPGFLAYNAIDMFQEICKDVVTIIQKHSSMEQDKRSRLLGELTFFKSFMTTDDLTGFEDSRKEAWKLIGAKTIGSGNCSLRFFGSPSVLHAFHKEVGTLEYRFRHLVNTFLQYKWVMSESEENIWNILESEILLNKVDFINSEIMAYKSQYMAEQLKLPQNSLAALLVIGRGELFKGNYDGLVAVLNKMDAWMDSPFRKYCFRTVDAAKCYLYLSLSQLSMAAPWIVCGEIGDDCLYPVNMSYAKALFARSLLLQKKYEQLLGVDKQLLEDAVRSRNLMLQAYCHCYDACAYREMGKPAVARDKLGLALEILLPDKLYMPVIEICYPLRELLPEVLKGERYYYEMNKIYDLMCSYEESIKKIQSDFEARSHNLSEREFQIAELAVKGMTNKEISRVLFISEATVKTTLLHIFEKLSIKSRVQLASYVHSKTK